MTAEELIRTFADARRIEIVGTGAFANDLRRILPPIQSSENPTLIVESSGDTSAIEAALDRVDDLGTIVLAGPLPELPLSLDLYSDLHVRGLTVVGITPDDPVWDALRSAVRL